MAKKSEPSPEPESDRSTTLWLVGGVVVLLALAGWMGWESYPVLAARTWPSAEGTVRTMKMFGKVKLGSSADPKQFQVDIEYEYVVNGKTYTGTTFNTRNNHLDPNEAAAVQQQYKAGSKCTVRYSPYVPSNSVIVPDPSWTAWGKLVIGVLALIGAGFCLVLAFWKPKPTEAKA
jgi:hypothetical protein